MSLVARLDRWGHEYWEEDNFAPQFKSLEQIIEAELDAEEAQQCRENVHTVTAHQAPAPKPATASTPAITRGAPFSTAGTANADQWRETTSAIAGATTMTNRSNHMAATPAVIDITPLEQSFQMERQDFDMRLANIAGITPEMIRAKTLADNLLDQGEAEEWAQVIADADTEAKRFLDAFKADPKFNEQRRLIKALKDNFDDLCDRITIPATMIRQICAELTKARLLAVNQKAEQERRALEAEQQVIAERERAEEVARLKAQAEAETDESEKVRLAIAAQQTAQAPVVPAAVPVAAFQPPKTGVSGTPVFYHSIKDWRAFCTMIAGLVPSITANENTTTVVLPGFQMVINFTKLKKNRQPLAGMQAREGIETRNYRK